MAYRERRNTACMRKAIKPSSFQSVRYQELERNNSIGRRFVFPQAGTPGEAGKLGGDSSMLRKSGRI